MRIFLTGATGLIGSAVLRRLVDGGHTVAALVRSAEQAYEIRDGSVTPVLGDLEQPQRFATEIAAADGVIHAGSPGYYSISAVDDAFISTVLMVLEGSGKPFVMTGGIWVYGDGADLTEDHPFAPPPLVCWRPALTDRVRNAAGVRGIVIAPGAVHGNGRGMHTIVASQRVGADAPALMTVGTGKQHWACVHVDDLADLYVRAFESAPAGSTFIGAAGDNPTVHEIAVALSHRLGLSGVVTETDDAAVTRLGQLGQALLLDQQAWGEHARTQLGWTPVRSSMLQDIENEPVVTPRPWCGTRAPRPLRTLREARVLARPRLVAAG
jgi:nucleoside-diphosphate-sugar epimerase